jgi:hypothetical protein
MMKYVLLILLLVIILIVALIIYGQRSFQSQYQKDVQQGLARKAESQPDILTEQDLVHLPGPIQQYLRLAGVVGKPKVHNFKVTFEGDMRSKDQEWFRFTSEQHNFMDAPERLFFMKAKVKGLPTAGYHAYKEGEARMLIKLLSLIPVVNISGPEMLKAETVTVFNDMCLMAPATLIDDRIQWEPIDDLSAKAVFTVDKISITATLFFNEKGELINFISDDRYDVNQKQWLRFSTPVKEYKNINGFHLISYGEAVWHYPEGEFVYGKFRVKNIEYNL